VRPSGLAVVVPPAGGSARSSAQHTSARRRLGQVLPSGVRSKSSQRVNAVTLNMLVFWLSGWPSLGYTHLEGIGQHTAPSGAEEGLSKRDERRTSRADGETRRQTARRRARPIRKRKRGRQGSSGPSVAARDPEAPLDGLVHALEVGHADATILRDDDCLRDPPRKGRLVERRTGKATTTLARSPRTMPR
jgi:hypothetical protein